MRDIHTTQSKADKGKPVFPVLLIPSTSELWSLGRVSEF